MFNAKMSFYWLCLISLLTQCFYWQQTWASPISQPIIALSVTQCGESYLLQVFSNGHVKFRGSYSEKVEERHDILISQNELKQLIKKFDEAEFFSEDNPERLLNGGIPSEAIRFRQGEREATVYYPSSLNNHLVSELKHEIIKMTKTDKWALKKITCLGFPNAKEPPSSRDLLFSFERLR